MNRLLFATLVASTALSTTGFSQTYSTRFGGIESPPSGGGKLTNNGVDWTQIKKKDGIVLVWSNRSNASMRKHLRQERGAACRGVSWFTLTR